MLTKLCADCGQELERRANGRWPKRCLECSQARFEAAMAVQRLAFGRGQPQLAARRWAEAIEARGLVLESGS